jgi:N-formylglutamate amidohydrolase
MDYASSLLGLLPGGRRTPGLKELLSTVGTYLPPEIADRLNANGRLLADTDWHIHELYRGLLPGASTIR